MKPNVSNALHSIPWWALLAGGFALLLGLAVFTTPFHLIRLEKSGSTPQEKRAIKREIDAAFSEGAIDIARGVVKEMRDRTRDDARREELDRALEEIDQARESMKEAGQQVLRSKREAAENVAEAVKEAQRAIADAQREAHQALKEAGADGDKVRKALDDSMKAAHQAVEDAQRAEQAEARGPATDAAGKAAEARALAAEAKQKLAEAKAKAAEARAARRSGGGPRITVTGPDPKKPIVDIQVNEHGASAGVTIDPPVPPLPPEVRSEIRRRLTGDLYRVGLGAGLILLFIPLFILAVVSKFFIDRSRAAQGLAEAKRKEAEYHRMSQQVTEAKLSALQAQVEPHFLYNTLASVQALTEVDPSQANAMTGHLIQYLRNALPKMRESVSTVGQEIELVRAYLNILQMRMGKRLAFEIDVPEDLLTAPFPPLMLPSLVENAIKHGLEPQREGGMVKITASAVDGRLRVCVADTGRGFGETLGAGVGLTNIRERLAALYGEGGKLTLEANTPQGVIATIEVPRDGARAAAGAGASAANGTAGAASAATPQPAAPLTTAQRTLAAAGAVERVWRKGLTFTFFVLVIVAAVFSGLAILGVMTGMLPVHMGEDSVAGPMGTLIGTAGIAVGFTAVVLALAIVLAVVYGLGFLFVGLAIFVPLVVLVALFPVLAPFLLVGLVIWWLVRRNRRKSQIESPDAHRNPG